MTAVIKAPSPLWYLTRGTGLVALILLTLSLALGVLNTGRWTPRGWPRFVTQGLHRNVSLLVVAMLAIHILTAELDTFAPVGWLSVVVPFTSPYRPIWLGMGTLAFDLLLALIITSLLRDRLGYRAWRAVHWLSYLSWPVALVHGLGTGSDARFGVMKLITVCCVGAVLIAAGWRITQVSPAAPGRRLAGAGLAAVATIVIGVWAVTGPLRPGWAKRAGTPVKLLASSRAAAPPSSSSSASSASTSPHSTPSAATGKTASTGAGRVPAPPFSGQLVGTLSRIGSASSNLVTIAIAAHVSGGMTGSLHVVLRGRPSDGGVNLEASSVTLGTTSAPQAYQGQVAALNGDQIIATVSGAGQSSVNLAINLQIDPANGSVQGTLQAQ